MSWVIFLCQTKAGYSVSHVIPSGDLYDHEMSDDCWCQPEMDDEDSVATHHSFDNREAFEEGRRKPS
jgi:hypothetical protein